MDCDDPWHAGGKPNRKRGKEVEFEYSREPLINSEKPCIMELCARARLINLEQARQVTDVAGIGFIAIGAYTLYQA